MGNCAPYLWCHGQHRRSRGVCPAESWDGGWSKVWHGLSARRLRFGWNLPQYDDVWSGSIMDDISSTRWASYTVDFGYMYRRDSPTSFERVICIHEQTDDYSAWLVNGWRSLEGCWYAQYAQILISLCSTINDRAASGRCDGSQRFWWPYSIPNASMLWLCNNFDPTVLYKANNPREETRLVCMRLPWTSGARFARDIRDVTSTLSCGDPQAYGCMPHVCTHNPFQSVCWLEASDLKTLGHWDHEGSIHTAMKSMGWSSAVSS